MATKVAELISYGELFLVSTTVKPHSSENHCCVKEEGNLTGQDQDKYTFYFVAFSLSVFAKVNFFV